MGVAKRVHYAVMHILSSWYITVVRLVGYICVRAARSRKSSSAAADGTKSYTGAVVTSNSDDAICDITDDVSDVQAEVLPLVAERPVTAASAVEPRPIACLLYTSDAADE